MRSMGAVLSVFTVGLALAVAPTAAPAAVVDSTAVPPKVLSFVDDAVVPPPGTQPLRRPQADRARAATPATYEIRFFTMATADGQVAFTSVEASQAAAAIDAFYSRTTSGAYRFRLTGTIDALPEYGDAVCAMDPAENAMKPLLPLTKSPDATDIIWVVVTPPPADGACEAVGRGYLGSPGIWVSEGGTPAERLRVLAHEIGHNLNLDHSKAVTPQGTVPSWPSGDTPAIEEYGDALDVMGVGGFWWCPAQCTWQQADISAHNLNLLGVLPADAIASVAPGAAQEVTISPVDSTTGIRAVYLPWLNRAKFVLDYRPPSHLGGSAAASGGPGAGVVVRLVDSAPDSGPDPYAVDGGTVALSEPTTQDSQVIRIGMPTGAEHLLPDGTTVRVVSASATEARVMISRPADTTPPDLDYDSLGDCTASTCTLPGTSALWENGKATYDLPLEVTDDFWLRFLTASARGPLSTVRWAGERANPGVRLVPPTPLPTTIRLSSGRHTVTVTATDSAGLQATRAWTLTLPTPVPATSWTRYTNTFSYAWPAWENLRCSKEGLNCLGLAIKSTGTCLFGVQTTLVSLRDDGSIIESRQVRVGSMRRGQATMAVAIFSGPLAEVDSYNFTSLGCARR